MTFSLPPLPYASNALEPYISQRTLEFHYGKHHQTYVTNLNNLIPGTPFETQTLEEIIMNTAKDAEKVAIFNNAAQIWNHTFYWHCLHPQGGKEPTGLLKTKIDETFGNYEAFRTAFKQAAISQFGSGWAWLIVDSSEKLQITKTGNADLPMAHHQTALLTCDVWEHAYYIDYQNRRPDYVDTFLDHLVNWDFVADNLKKAL